MSDREAVRTWDGERGVALVEFAVAIPLLILLLLGVAEIGRYAYFSIIVANAARAGTAYGAQNGTTALDSPGIQSAVQNDGVNGISALAVTSSASCSCWNGASYSATPCSLPLTCASGHPVEFISVTVSGTAHSIFKYPLLPSSLPVSATATSRVVAQ